MTSWTAVAFAADAALHCPTCAERRFDLDGCDHEGNYIVPVFADESYDYPQVCDTCGDELNVVLSGSGLETAEVA